eukprot:357233-Chlamydomonas_euryale.AAC.15
MGWLRTVRSGVPVVAAPRPLLDPLRLAALNTGIPCMGPLPKTLTLTLTLTLVRPKYKSLRASSPPPLAPVPCGLCAHFEAEEAVAGEKGVQVELACLICRIAHLARLPHHCHRCAAAWAAAAF